MSSPPTDVTKFPPMAPMTGLCGRWIVFHRSRIVENRPFSIYESRNFCISPDEVERCPSSTFKIPTRYIFRWIFNEMLRISVKSHRFFYKHYTHKTENGSLLATYSRIGARARIQHLNIAINCYFVSSILWSVLSYIFMQNKTWAYLTVKYGFQNINAYFFGKTG